MPSDFALLAVSVIEQSILEEFFIFSQSALFVFCIRKYLFFPTIC